MVFEFLSPSKPLWDFQVLWAFGARPRGGVPLRRDQRRAAGRPGAGAAAGTRAADRPGLSAEGIVPWKLAEVGSLDG